MIILVLIQIYYIFQPLALNSQSLDSQNLLPLRRNHPVLDPRPVPHDLVDSHVVPAARLPHRLDDIGVLPARVPVGGVEDGDFRIAGVGEVDEAGKGFWVTVSFFLWQDGMVGYGREMCRRTFIW